MLIGLRVTILLYDEKEKQLYIHLYTVYIKYMYMVYTVYVYINIFKQFSLVKEK